jgi:hypothetical protein
MVLSKMGKTLFLDLVIMGKLWDIQNCKTIKTSTQSHLNQVWWYTSVVPATPEAKAGGWLKPRNSKLAWTT